MTRHSKVSAPVSVDEMLPNENGCYTCYVHKKVSGSHSITTRLLQFNPANKSWIGLEDKEYVTHWLEEKENVYVLSELELIKLMSEFTYELRIGTYEMYSANNGAARAFLESKTNPQTENK